MSSFFVRFTFVLASTCLLAVDGLTQTPVAEPSGTINASPVQNPWETLDEMPSDLGRFVLAADQDRIYQLGGIDFDIRRGQRYGHRFAAYNPNEQKWENLPNVSLGTGGAHMAMWPAQESIVMISGIKKLGDRFPSRGITVGTYAIARKRWQTQVVRTSGLGRVAAMTHLDGNRFLLVAGDDGLNADRTAILDMGNDQKPVVTAVGEFPKGGRILAIARIEDSVTVLQSGPDTARLQRFSSSTGEHLDSLDLSTSCDWTDKLFAWQGNLLIWKNSDPSRPQSYQHASQLLMVDTTSGNCETLHPQHAGPIARRSSDGIVVGDAFYVFGGQRGDKEWLNDAYRYQFRVDQGYDSPTTDR